MANGSSSRIDLEALRRLRARHSRMFKLFLLSVVLVLVGVPLCDAIPPPVGVWLALLPPVGLGLAAVLVYPLAGTPCPRCGRPYYRPCGFWVLYSINLTNRKCVHCGLSLDTEEQETVEPETEGDAATE